VIRHARARSAPAVFPLAVAMIESCLAAACQAAITLSTITVRTEKERRAAIARQANPKPQKHFARNRHASPQAGLDNDDSFVPR